MLSQTKTTVSTLIDPRENLKVKHSRTKCELVRVDCMYTIQFFMFKLQDVEDTDHMEWFPSVFPRNVRCVISAVTDSRSAVRLSDRFRTPPSVPLHVGELNVSARQEIVKRTLGKYNKVMFKVSHRSFTHSFILFPFLLILPNYLV